MSYVRFNYPSKRALRADVTALREAGVTSSDVLRSPSLTADTKARIRRLTIASTAVTGDDPKNGEAFLEGPHYPQPHKWYAKVAVVEGVVVRVIS